MKALSTLIILLVSLNSYAGEETEVLKGSPILAKLMWDKFETLYKEGKISMSGPIGIEDLAKNYHISKVVTDEPNGGTSCTVSFHWDSKDQQKTHTYSYSLARENFVTKSSEEEKFLKSLCSPFFNAQTKSVLINDEKRSPKEKESSQGTEQPASPTVIIK